MTSHEEVIINDSNKQNVIIVIKLEVFGYLISGLKLYRKINRIVTALTVTVKYEHYCRRARNSCQLFY